MKKIKTFVLSFTAVVSISYQTIAQNLDSNKQAAFTPMTFYKINSDLVANYDIKSMFILINQVQDSIFDGDPNPQPLINYNLVTKNIDDKIVDDFLNTGNTIEIRSSCQLIKEMFSDKHGYIFKPQAKTQLAINCGCDLVDSGFDIAYSYLKANSLFKYGKNCPK